MKRPNGVILYSGPSLLDGAPIVAIAVGLVSGSSNRKTGAMLQTYILRADLSPVEAIKTGADASICGDCKLRGVLGKRRVCYVNLGQGPLSVFRGHKRGIYPVAASPRDIGRGRIIRLGTYGDPAAVPVEVWNELISEARGHTGYSHQWKTRPDLRGIVMASADNVQEKSEAWAEGWRTFRLADAPTPGEIVCPSLSGVHCADCRLCDGAGAAKSITIPAHGIGKGYHSAMQA
jgi:hypothetical protein